MLKSAQKGFTLVELMVVVSIIVILATIGLTVYSNVQGQARDAKRKEDLNAYSSAYETTYNAFNTTGKYRTLTAADFSSGILPVDPINGTRNGITYQYNGLLSAAANAYCVCARLENKSGNSSDNACTASTGDQFYCVSNRR